MFSSQNCASEQTCKPPSADAEPCSLQILSQFERFYQGRIAEIEANVKIAETQRNELKLKIMTDWIRDLGEQNTMLVQIVHDLEQATVDRVKLLENKLQETSNLISHDMMNSDKPEEDLNALSNRLCELVQEQDSMKTKIDFLHKDIDSLLELIKRGRIENNWDLEGITFFAIQPSDIPMPAECTCGQFKSHMRVFNDKNTQITCTQNISSLTISKETATKKLNENCLDNESKFNKHVHEYDCKIKELQMSIQEKCRENEKIKKCYAILKKESVDSIMVLKNKNKQLEDELQDLNGAIAFRDELIQKLRSDMKANNSKGSSTIRKVRMDTESCQKLESTTVDDKFHVIMQQLEEQKNLIAKKDDEIMELKKMCNEQRNMETSNMTASFLLSDEKQSELVTFLTNLATSMEQDKKIILNLQLEYETVLNHLKQTETMYENDVALAYEKLEDIALCIRDYRDKVINENRSVNDIGDNFNAVGDKIEFIKKLFQNKCEMCAKENVLSKIKDMTSKVTSGIQTLSKMQGKRDLLTISIDKMVEKINSVSTENLESGREQKEIFAAMIQQFRIMEEFRICTVEVQAATEDLREEMSAVVANLNARHCKYKDFAQTIFQVQEYLIRTKENVCDVIHRLELQDEERNRHNERIINSKVRLKDMKNEFNQNQSELSKYLSDEHSNIPKSNLLESMKVHMCNNLLASVTEEVEQLVNNLGIFQSQGCCTLSTMSELKKQLTVMEHNVKELKKKSDQVLLDNETAQSAFVKRLEKLEKYECEVDNCHTKMQDALESIINIRDQMNEFGCIKDCENTSQCTNDTIKVKEDLRKLQKKYEELKCKINKDSSFEQQDYSRVDQRNSILDLQEQINSLKNDIKCKQEANIYLKQSIELLEKELQSVRIKSDEYRRASTIENIELRKRIFQYENPVHNAVMCNNDSSLSNEMDFNKSHRLFNNSNTEKLDEKTLNHGLQNIPQLFKVLQDTIQVINANLREVGDKLTRLITYDSSSVNSTDDSLKAALELLTRHAESINYCSFEVEKIKATLYSKDKLMENMDEIIRIQKDSIMISQSEVESLHKTLQEKIDVQEKVICNYEAEKRQLHKQVDLQMQTIGHLQNAVVEAKRTIDQLTNSVAMNNSSYTRIVKSLSILLTETQSQYNQCFNEASAQDTLLELQRDAIYSLQKKIHLIECGQFLNAFILHLIYYFILFKYQEELEVQSQSFITMKNKINKLENENHHYQYQCVSLEREKQEVKKEVDKLRCDLEESRKKSSTEKQIDALSSENTDLRKQLNTYKLDFDLIEQEMKKMGIINLSIEKFKVELASMRSENAQYRLDIERYLKSIEDLKRANDVLKNKLFELKLNKDNQSEKYKEKILQLQNEICIQHDKIRRLNTKLCSGETVISKQVQVIEDLKGRLFYNEHHIENCCSDLHFSKETIYDLRAHIDSLKVTLADKFDYITKLKGDNQIVKNENKILRAELEYIKYESDQTKCQLQESQKKYEKILQDLNKYLQNNEKRFVAMQPNFTNESSCPRQDGSKNHDWEKKLSILNEKLSSKTAALEELQSKFNALTTKYESSERSCQRQKDEMMLLDKKLQVLQQKFQNCTEKNEDLLRQNKSLEDHNNKCMAELEDIVLQLEDMQSSLVDLRNECDAKTHSLDAVSIELERMKASKSEVCEESKYVLEWVRVWMRQQKQTTAVLQNKLYDKQQQLLHLAIDKKKFTTAMRRLKRVNKILTKRLKLIHRPTRRHATATVVYTHSSDLQKLKTCVPSQKCWPCHSSNYEHSPEKQRKAPCSKLQKNYPDNQYRKMDKILDHEDNAWFPTLDFVIEQIPRSSQIYGNIGIAKKIQDDMVDGGYQTSSSK